MAEQSEKVVDIDPRFSSLLCVHANGNKMRILKLDVFIFFFFCCSWIYAIQPIDTCTMQICESEIEMNKKLKVAFLMQ